jgi:hypothetical protein
LASKLLAILFGEYKCEIATLAIGNMGIDNESWHHREGLLPPLVFRSCKNFCTSIFLFFLDAWLKKMSKVFGTLHCGVDFMKPNYFLRIIFWGGYGL